MKISNKSALELLEKGLVFVNDQLTFENIYINESDRVVVDNQVVNEGVKLIYIAYYKPKGIETTQNSNIEKNLKSILPFSEELFPCGRLDKESEGLLILTNDGRFYHKIVRKENETEKEYIVKVTKEINEDFVIKMSSGIVIMGKMTSPCKVSRLDSCTFSIVLMEGRNRQIRRMCYKLGYEVESLKRIRIGNLNLGNLNENEYRYFDIKDVF